MVRFALGTTERALSLAIFAHEMLFRANQGVTLRSGVAAVPTRLTLASKCILAIPTTAPIRAHWYVTSSALPAVITLAKIRIYRYAVKAGRER